MVKTKRLVAVALAILMILGSVSMTSYAWNARSSDGFTLTVNTEILREVNGEWVKTDKVERGETVKARVYLGTDYYTNSGELLFFYSNDFFKDAYGTDSNKLTVNPYYESSYGINGEFFAPASKPAQAVEAQMLKDERITSEEANEYNPINIVYSFAGNVKNKKLDATKWFCEFVLTVKDDAPAGKLGRFLAFEKTAGTPEYTDGYINVPKGTYDGYSESVTAMFNWNATLAFANAPVEIYQNLVSATFNANGGAFNDGKDRKYFEGDAGEALSIEEPACDGYEFVGWDTDGNFETVEASEITAYPAEDTTYTAVWKNSEGEVSETLGFRTEIHRLNEETGEYEKTERVKRGETVKARLFVDTSYFTTAGDIIVFYDNDFFTDAYSTDEPTELKTDDPATNHVNKSATSSAAILGVEGRFTKTSTSNDAIENLVNNGYITADQAKETNAITIAYAFKPTDCAKISGDEWFVEFDLQVLNTAEDYGDFFIIKETIQNSDEGFDAYINIPLGEEGKKQEDGEHLPMFEWDVLASVSSTPVTVESAITLEGEGGMFAENSEGTYVIEGYIGNAPVAPEEPAREGYAFMGWIDENGDPAEIPAEIPYEDTTLYATWSEKANIKFVFNNGDPDLEQEVIAGQPFEAPENPVKDGYRFVGWDTDKNPATVEVLPDVYSAEDATYSAVFEAVAYYIHYYVLNPLDLQFDLVDMGVCEFGQPIKVNPTTYKAPEGYTLSPAYKDVTFSTAVAEGELMPAKRVDLYYKLVINTYNAIFDADGGVFADGTTEDIIVPTVYGENIVAPAAPTMEGYTFKGWTPSVGTMEGKDTVYTATWEIATFDAKYIVDGATWEAFPTEFGAEVDVPADPYKEGYTFTGWSPKVDATMPAHDTEYIAVFEANEYDAIFKLEEDDADEDAYDKIPAKFDQPITEPAVAPEKEGFDFGGWVDENGNPVGTMNAEGKTFYAVWNPATDTKYYIATYTMGTNGTYSETPDAEPIEKSGTTGAPVEVTPNAAEGFKVDEEKSVLTGTILPDGSTTLKVYYAREKVTVTFDANDGMFTITDDNGVEVEKEEIVYELYYGAAVVAPADPELTGSTFKGWNPAVVNKAIEDAIYVAQWNVNKYTITFDTDGGDEIAPITQAFGTDVTAPANPEKEGYTFDKWVDADGNEVSVPAKMPDEDTVLKATWTVNKYEVTFKVDGVIVEGYPKEAEFGATIPVAANPSKGGWMFIGWKDAEGKTPADYGTMPSKNLEFTAQWASETGVGYVLEVYKMDTNGSYPATATETINFHDGIVDEIRKVDYTAPEGFTLDNTNSVLSGKIPATGTLVLKAYLSRNQYKLTVDVDGKQTVTDYYYGEAVTAPETPVKEGTVKFAGWVDANGNEASVPAIMPATDVTVYASWTKSAKFDAGEGIFKDDGSSVKEIPVEEGEAITPPAAPEKEGYDFVGWGTEADPNTPVTDFGTMDADGESYVAIWTESAYEIKFIDYKAPDNGPEAPIEEYELATGEIKHNGTVTLPDPPVFGEGKTYEFVGWFDADGKEYKEGDIYEGTTDLVLYAEYNKIPVKLVPVEGSTTVVDRNGVRESYNEGTDRDGNAYTPVNGVPYETPESFRNYFIYGIAFKQRDSVLLSKYFTTVGDGRIEIIHVSSKYSCAGTGSIVNVYDRLGTEETTDDVLVETFYIVIFGDINGDAASNSLDASLISEEALGVTSWSVRTSRQYVPCKLMAADVNYDSKVRSLDASLVEHHALGVGKIDQVKGIATTVS